MLNSSLTAKQNLLFQFPFYEVQNSLNSDNRITKSNEPSKVSKFLWMELVDLLRKNQNLRILLKENLDILNVSMETLSKFKHPTPQLKQLVRQFGNQNCIRAISVLEDLTLVKKNQYKFMYEGVTLGRAIELLVRESIFLYQSLSRQNSTCKHFLRLARSWIDYILQIHKVPEDAQEKLKNQIVIQIELTNGMGFD
jgi:hypothetical protein